MTPEEKKKLELLRQKQYPEALRYVANAKELLTKAGEIKYDRYQDPKYIRTACGTAYNGVLLALDVLAKEKGISIPKSPKRKDIYFYQQVVKNNGKHRAALQDAYNFLHLSGYYDGNTHTDTIKNGFSAAKILIDLIKPATARPIPATRPSTSLRARGSVIASRQRQRGNPPSPSLRAAGVAIHQN